MKKSITIKNRVWTKDFIKYLINTNEVAVYKALKRLYSFQTAEEQSGEETVVSNGKGFNAYDAKYLSGLSTWVLAGKKLTTNQLKEARKRLMKYSEQLLDYIIETN